MKKITLSVLSILSLLALSCSHTDKGSTKDKLRAAVNSDHRSMENKARDRFRNPVETLSFFGLKPDMTVVEISPGSGWYTEILGNYLSDGHLYLAIPPLKSDREYRVRQHKAIKEKIARNPGVYKKVSYTTFEPPSLISPLAPENSADMVLTFRNVHGWIRAGKAQEVFNEFYKVLKPGGVLGLVTHRASDKLPQDKNAKSGYVREDFVVMLAEKSGFKLVGKSEINANPKDTKDYKDGVWTLPPSLKLKDKDRDKYLKIGESDRMTLRFKK